MGSNITQMTTLEGWNPGDVEECHYVWKGRKLRSQ